LKIKILKKFMRTRPTQQRTERDI